MKWIITRHPFSSFYHRSRTGVVFVMTYLVTGGAGSIGSNFLFYVLNKHKDYRFVCVDKLTYSGNAATIQPLLLDDRFRFVCADISNKEDIFKIFSQEHPDIVVNFAAECSVDKSIDNPEVFIQSNIVGTHVLLEACRKYGIKRFHQVSTDEVYGSLPLDHPELNFVETSHIKPSSPYSSSKASADLLVYSYFHTFGLPATISRCTNNYGPYHFPEKLIPKTIIYALHDKKIPVFGDGLNVRDWIYVEDHCAAIESIITSGTPGEIYNVGANNEVNNINIIKSILSMLGKTEELISYIPDRKGHDRRYAVDAAKIRSSLNWNPKTPIDSGIRTTVNWYLENEEWWKNIINHKYIEINRKIAEKHKI